MSCSTNAAIREARRMKCLDYYPRGDVEVELLEALQVTAADDADAKRIVDDWINENAIAPKPSEIRSLKKRPEWKSAEKLPPPPPSKSGFIDRGDEYLDPNWRAICRELGWPTTAEWYNAFWHDPGHSARWSADQILDWPFLSQTDRSAVREHLGGSQDARDRSSRNAGGVRGPRLGPSSGNGSGIAHSAREGHS